MSSYDDGGGGGKTYRDDDQEACSTGSKPVQGGFGHQHTIKDEITQAQLDGPILNHKVKTQSPMRTMPSSTSSMGSFPCLSTHHHHPTRLTTYQGPPPPPPLPDGQPVHLDVVGWSGGGNQADGGRG